MSLPPLCGSSPFSPLLTQAVRRDTFGCAITGAYDVKYVDYLFQNGLPLPRTPATITNACHIVPPYVNALPRRQKSVKVGFTSTAWFISDIFQAAWNSTVWSQFQHFGVHLDELNGANIHWLCNVITMGVHYHGLFDQLRLWLEPDPVCYSSPIALHEPIESSGQNFATG